MCETLPPFGECGFGTCVNGSCICDGPYLQNFEFFYGELPQTGLVTFCDYDPNAMTTVAVALLVLTTLSLVLEVFILKTWKQVRRLLPLLIGYVLLAISLIWRLVLINESLFGFDVWYTLVLTTAMFLLNLQQIVYLNKFVLYAMNVFRFKASTRRITSLIVRLQYVLTVLIFFGMVPVWATSVVASQRVSGEMIAAANVIFICAHTGFTVSGYVLFTKYIADLELITKNSPSTGTYRDTAFLRKCRKSIPRMRFVREALGLSNVWSITSNFLALLLSGWLKLWVFLIYVNFFSFLLSSLIVIQSSGKANFASKKQLPRITLTSRRTGTEKGSGSGSQPNANLESISKDL